MRNLSIEIPVKVCAYDELDEQDRMLIDKAKEMTRHSYAPFSHFSVGAAARLGNGIVVTGSNQENVAFPSGLCAERTALFYANSQYPDVPVLTLAIAARNADGEFTAGPATPCGACRQVMAEVQKRNGKPLRVLLYGTESTYCIDNVDHLLPLSFSADNMK